MLVPILLVFAEFLLVIATAALVVWIWMVGQHFSAPYVVTRRQVIKSTLDALQLEDAEVFYDLGSGDGRIIIAALKRFPHLRGIGVEARSGFVFLSRLAARWQGIESRADFHTGDIFQTNLSKATRVYAFLSHPMMAKLESKFDKELKGARLVSLGFPLPNRKADEIIEVETSSKHYRKIYVYDYPAL